MIGAALWPQLHDALQSQWQHISAVMRSRLFDAFRLPVVLLGTVLGVSLFFPAHLVGFVPAMW